MMFANRLRQLSWTEGEDLQIAYRYGRGNAASMLAQLDQLEGYFD
jgi:hypothetical protein